MTKFFKERVLEAVAKIPRGQARKIEFLKKEGVNFSLFGKGRGREGFL